ncbi:Imidazole glycerol phosphate synthase subunit HisF [Pseudodesulfovibrio hydrargyri]|uniref:imidazole glycerol-phosphate synthase n=1 Tax=Pseudodesulfovibrio hydrargyri TaxID=2125990 RepID=A0A1J5N356_9BACT|nr:imidazole glycerol phosphate synthase cyclase subunit [Pseudodesulfovibrio hydrargyri]OIQ50051.1 Imidazole glycerol phosphate synthase subunit HisF [Pseudodesulfovibrio hydrargyri]
MLRKRLVTVLTFNEGVLFRTRNFIPDYRYTLNFVDAWSVDEIIVLDITREPGEYRGYFEEAVSWFASQCFVPLTVGGGVRGLDDFERLLGLGADKIAVNSGAVERPELISEASRQYGSQCVVLSMDAARTEGGGYAVRSHFGARDTGMPPDAWARKGQELGAGEILVQSIERDGMLEGYDNELNNLVSGAVDIPVLGCSGAGNWEHFEDGFKEGGLSAVCTTNIYHFTESSIASAKLYLKQNGVLMR